MPFDFDDYQTKCNGMTTEQLHKEWDNYTRQITGGATSTATSVLLSPLTAGVSLVGLGISAPRIHNARKKREIIEAGLQARGTTHNTRPMDVLAPMAIQGTLSGLTLGLMPPGAETAVGAMVQHGIEFVATQTAVTPLESTGAIIAESRKNSMAKLSQSFSPFFEPQQQDGVRHGYEATPPLGLNIGLYQPMSGTPGLQKIYEETDNLYMQQDLAGYDSKPPLQPNIHFATTHSNTWPTYSPQTPDGDGKVQALDPSRVQFPSAKTKRKPVASQPYRHSSLDSFQDLSMSPEAPPAYQQPSTLSRGLVRSISIRSNDGKPPVYMSAEEEILFLRGRLLQLEMQKRGAELQIPSSISDQPLAQVEVLVESKTSMQEPYLDNQAPWTTTSLPQSPEQIPQEQLQPLPLHTYSPSGLDLPSMPYNPQDSFTSASGAVSPPQVNTDIKRSHVIPRRKAGSTAASHGQRRHDSYSPSTQQRPAVERQDSEDDLASLTAASFSPPPSYHPPPPLSESPPFIAQAFGLPPPEVMMPKSLSSRSSLPSISRVAGQEHRGSEPAIGFSPKMPGPAHRDSCPSLPPVSQAARHRDSQSSLSQVSPPPPYFPPPPGADNTKVKEENYFNQNIETPSLAPNGLTARASQSTVGLQGWQWGMGEPAYFPVDLKTSAEPNYGPSPPVPAWR